MGHIVVAASGVNRFHLHERLLRALRQRGHRATLWSQDPAAEAFWRRQYDAVAELGDPAAERTALRPEDLAALLPAAASARRRRRWVERAERAMAWFARERPDLLVLHQDRGPVAQLLQFVARTAAVRVLWTGDGLLPHTLQVDERGLDGDASCGQRRAGEFRVVRGDAGLLASCLANVLARTTPIALPPHAIVPTLWRDRWRDAAAAWRSDGPRAALRCWRAARLAAAPVPRAPEVPSPEQLPESPFVAVLLQAATDARLVLDAPERPSARALVAATLAAVARTAPDCAVVAVAPRGGRAPRGLGVPVLPAACAPDVAATALAIVTVNHPLASVALLAGTPVVHLGRAPWSVPGVAVRASLGDLGPALAHALAHDYPTLRERFLSWLFGHGHVWCSTTHPNHNGMLGLVQAIEARLAAPADRQPPLGYRRGPTWPLAAESRE